MFFETEARGKRVVLWVLVCLIAQVAYFIGLAFVLDFFNYHPPVDGSAGPKFTILDFLFLSVVDILFRAIFLMLNFNPDLNWRRRWDNISVVCAIQALFWLGAQTMEKELSFNFGDPRFVSVLMVVLLVMTPLSICSFALCLKCGSVEGKLEKPFCVACISSFLLWGLILNIAW